MPEDWENGGFGVYIHWPFCQAKCPYCDFNSHVAQQIDQTRWKKAYLREIDRYAAEVPSRVVSSVFFGGGTPSLMDPNVVAAILDRIRQHWPQANDLEVTLEANPSSVESGRFRDYFGAGISRVSLGVQALNDEDLRRLGRLHSVKEALTAFDIAKSCFQRVSFDLIYARQDQSVAQWTAELKQALSLAVDHLSAYQLTIEPQTAFGDRYKIGKLPGLPDEDTASAMFDVTQEIAEQAGYPAYEISNHSRPGAESRHNSLYWRYGDYLGIGPGAHGRLTLNGQRFATETRLMPTEWLRAAEEGNGDSLRTGLSQEDQVTEFLLMGLRMVEGISLDRYATLAGQFLDEKVIDQLLEIGMIRIDAGRLQCTIAGRRLLNSVIAKLLE